MARNYVTKENLCGRWLLCGESRQVVKNRAQPLPSRLGRCSKVGNDIEQVGHFILKNARHPTTRRMGDAIGTVRRLLDECDSAEPAGHASRQRVALRADDSSANKRRIRFDASMIAL